MLRSAGSTDQVFLLNKHRKVDLGAFDPQRGVAPPRKGREGRLSQGEEGGEAETVLLRRAASLAHVEAGSSSSAGPGASANTAQVGSSHRDIFEYRVEQSCTYRDFFTILRLVSLQYITKLAMSQSQKPQSLPPQIIMYTEDAHPSGQLKFLLYTK